MSVQFVHEAFATPGHEATKAHDAAHGEELVGGTIAGPDGNPLSKGGFVAHIGCRLHELEVAPGSRKPGMRSKEGDPVRSSLKLAYVVVSTAHVT